MPFDAVQICCESVTVKGFDPVEGTYKLAMLGSFIPFCIYKNSVKIPFKQTHFPIIVAPSINVLLMVTFQSNGIDK